MTMLFINTLKAPFINNMLGRATKSFTDIVMSGEMIENAIRCGKIEVGESTRSSAPKKRENEVGNVSPGYPNSVTCEYYAGVAGPSIENCTSFKRLVEKLIKAGVVKFDDTPGVGNPLPSHTEKGVNTIVEYIGRRIKLSIAEVRTPLREVWKKMQERGLVPQELENKSRDARSYYNKRVPWDYNCTVTVSGKEISADMSNSEVEHIERKSSVIRGGDEKTEPLINELVTENEAKEFLKFLKHINKLNRLVSNISADNFISFSDDEIPPGGMRSTKALHITTRCKGYTLPGITGRQLSYENIPKHSESLRWHRKKSDGKDLPLLIGPNTYEVDFLVMDIKPSYNCLLGRPWIHSVGAVPSSLHQKLKLVTEGRLITINTEEDIIVSVTSGTLYIENDTEAIECSFRSLEFVNATFISKGGRVPVLKISEATWMSLRLMVGRGALPGRGLRKYLQGPVKVPGLVDKHDHFGLGHRPDAQQRREELERKRERRRVRLNGVVVKWRSMTFPHISNTFVSGGIIHSGPENVNREMAEDMMRTLSINTVSEESPKEGNLEGIHPYEPGSVLDNWTAEEIPVVFRTKIESPDIDVMSNAVTDPEFPDEQDMCLEGPQDFTNDGDCSVSPDLLRMVEREGKLIIPHKETIESVILEEGKEFKDVFAWSYQDMLGLSADVAVHPNVIPVPKKDGKVRMCVDYRDLNKASPKDNFPLPHINTLVDNTTGYSLFSFMDGFSGYNQIKMHPEDMEKTMFITLWGTFSYKVMPFGLKNAGATYQRAMVTLFHDMMYKEIEVYVDDMIVKSRIEKDHIQVLRKLFLRLRKFQLKLNPTKCTFGARLGKLIGFVVSERGIEVDPDKVRAIQELPPPRTQKEVRSPDRPLIMYLTIFGNSMGCVLGQQDETGKKEKTIYYLSKKFTKCEMRYSPIEKLCCALVWTTRRLRQYMLYHTTWLISKLDPLKYMMESIALNGRMARWQILLSEFDIVYVNQKAVKGSAIADFLASRVLNDYEPLNFDFPNEDLMFVAATEEDTLEDRPWKLNFDGASKAVGNGVEAVLISPNGDHYPFTCKLDLDRTNNMEEYEACIMGIRAAIDRKVKVLEELTEEFDDITFFYLPRDENQMADALATLASMIRVNE
ncbi:RNA-directed DNA polymerase (Reverse transcriptase), Ribonuclease H-like protein [Gossypium australe]|uniref:RNA-directed DNA polymerase (Reverse transcriptase), Ribonuclease H-like protein n=1 Tax=Gossypium australe TaxID=47621 RepID=A0A5B6UY19_9ROSI|nr:RNA-directed DNA polymerase (Reverse transcriptase), Ribonuclease H-like protein [Gossypium australe]